MSLAGGPEDWSLARDRTLEHAAQSGPSQRQRRVVSRLPTNELMRCAKRREMKDALRYVTPWRATDAGERIGLKRRLEFEVTPTHPLWGVECEVVGKSEANDDIVIEAADGRFGIVHLVWGEGPGNSRWPATYLFETRDDVSLAMQEWSQEAGFLDE